MPFHLNLFAARNWFQVPNSYDQLSQDQKQRVLTWNIAPGYQHTFSAHPADREPIRTAGPGELLCRAAIPFADTPMTASQTRFLTNYGDQEPTCRYSHGRHELKFGTQTQQTRLLENFQFGITESGL